MQGRQQGRTTTDPHPTMEVCGQPAHSFVFPFSKRLSLPLPAVFSADAKYPRCIRSHSDAYFCNHSGSSRRSFDKPAGRCAHRFRLHPEHPARSPGRSNKYTSFFFQPLYQKKGQMTLTCPFLAVKIKQTVEKPVCPDRCARLPRQKPEQPAAE